MKSPGLDLPERGGGLLPCLTRSLAPPRRLPIRASPTLLGWALWMTNQTLSPTAYTLTLTHTPFLRAGLRLGLMPAGPSGRDRERR